MVTLCSINNALERLRKIIFLTINGNKIILIKQKNTTTFPSVFLTAPTYSEQQQVGKGVKFAINLVVILTLAATISAMALIVLLLK